VDTLSAYTSREASGAECHIPAREADDEYVRPIRWVLGLAVVATACAGPTGQIGTWYDRDGSPVPEGNPLVLHLWRGSDHCDWQDSLFVAIAWPLIRPVPAPSMGDPRTRVYVWHPEGAEAPITLSTTPSLVRSMPAEARYSGIHRGSWQLWVSPSMSKTAIFMTDGDIIQRWAFATSGVGCL
jgi:hypothetical protein